MAQRFKDTEIWSEDWYCDLGGEYMLFWNYITDKCDNAGIWKPNKIDFEIKTKYRINLDSFFEKAGGGKKRIVLLENGRWFILGFINYQWFNKHDSFDLVLSNKLHLSIFELLEKNKVPLKMVRGLREVLKPSRDKGKGIEGKGSGEREKILPENDFLIYDSEKELLENRIQFEKICIATGTSEPKAKKELHVYHLWLTKNSKYPIVRFALFAGFESWLLTGKKFKNNEEEISNNVPGHLKKLN